MPLLPYYSFTVLGVAQSAVRDSSDLPAHAIAIVEVQRDGLRTWPSPSRGTYDAHFFFENERTLVTEETPVPGAPKGSGWTWTHSRFVFSWSLREIMLSARSNYRPGTPEKPAEPRISAAAYMRRITTARDVVRDPTRTLRNAYLVNQDCVLALTGALTFRYKAGERLDAGTCIKRVDEIGLDLTERAPLNDYAILVRR